MTTESSLSWVLWFQTDELERTPKRPYCGEEVGGRMQIVFSWNMDVLLTQTGRYSDSPSRLKDKVSFQDRMGWSLSVVISVISKVELLKRVFVGCDEDSS